MTSPLDATATAFGGAPLAPSTRGFAPPSVSQRCSTSICYLFENYCNLLLQFAKKIYGNYIVQAETLKNNGTISVRKYKELLIDAYRYDIVYGEDNGGKI